MAVNINIQTFIDAIGKLSNADQLKLNNVIWKDAMTGNDFAKLHTIKSGVRNGDLIPLGDKGKGYTFMQSTKGLASQCDDLPCDISTTLSTKQWNTGRYTCSVEICYKDLEAKFLDFFNSDKCTLTEITESAFVLFLKDLIAGHVQDSLWVKAYFGENASASTYLNGNDGIFVQLFANIPTTATNRVTILENANTDYATQSALDPQRGFEVFNELYKKRSRTLRKRKDAKIHSTRTLAENYLFWLRDQKQVQCCQKDPTTSTYMEDSLTIWGMPIVIVDEWDEIINDLADFNDGTKWDNPHRAILTYADNMPIGTCEVDAFSNFEVKVNNYTDQFKLKPEYTFDAKVLDFEDVVLAV